MTIKAITQQQQQQQQQRQQNRYTDRIDQFLQQQGPDDYIYNTLR
jgi:hypothetical protein